MTLLAEAPWRRAGLREAVTSFLDAAEAAGEIEPCDFKGMAGGLYTDYLAGVVSYWLADTSGVRRHCTVGGPVAGRAGADPAQRPHQPRAAARRLRAARSQMARLAQHGSGLLGMLQMAQQGHAAAPAAATAPTAAPGRDRPRNAQTARHGRTAALPPRKRRPHDIPATVKSIAIPPGTAIHAAMPGAQFFDAYEVADPIRPARRSDLAGRGGPRRAGRSSSWRCATGWCAWWA